MSVTGLCQICEQQTATDDCIRCGTIVCRTHYHEHRGICADCAGPGESPGSGPTHQF